MYQIILDIALPGNTYKPVPGSYSFDKPRFPFSLSESFIPAQGTVMEFEHEGRWWSGTVQDKITTVFPNVVKGHPDYVVTLKFGKLYEIDKPVWECA